MLTLVVSSLLFLPRSLISDLTMPSLSLSLGFFLLTNPLFFFVCPDLQPDEVRQLFTIPKVLPLPRVHACWGGWPTLAGPVPDPLQSCALETQRQLRPLHSLHPEKGANIDYHSNWVWKYGIVDSLISKIFCFCSPINRMPGSRGQGGHWTRTAGMRAPTRNVASSSPGPATGALGRAQRRKT